MPASNLSLTRFKHCPVKLLSDVHKSLDIFLDYSRGDACKKAIFFFQIFSCQLPSKSFRKYSEWRYSREIGRVDDCEQKHWMFQKMFLPLWTRLTRRISCCLHHLWKTNFRKMPGPNYADILQGSCLKAVLVAYTSEMWEWTCQQNTFCIQFRMNSICIFINLGFFFNEGEEADVISRTLLCKALSDELLFETKFC